MTPNEPRTPQCQATKPWGRGERRCPAKATYGDKWCRTHALSVGGYWVASPDLRRHIEEQDRRLAIEAEAVAEKDSQLEALHRALEQFADDLDTDAGRPPSERTWHGDYATRLRKLWRAALESPTAVPTQEKT
jgi:hypothetical protein